MSVPDWMAEQWKAEYLARLPRRCRYKVLESNWIDPLGRVQTLYHLWDNTDKKHLIASVDYRRPVNLAEMMIMMNKRLREIHDNAALDQN